MSNPTAALLLIGNEILSGRTVDKNLNHLARRLNDVGIRFMEARVVKDTPDAIIGAVTALSETYDYVFTTGGIGPTHDDITTACVAKAFGKKLYRCASTARALTAAKTARGEKATDATLKMADFPEGSVLINNPISVAPGFMLENVIVMAGIPQVAHTMMEGILPQLTHGNTTHSETVLARVSESDVATPLAELQDYLVAQGSDIEIGSYPIWDETERAGTNLVLRGTNLQELAKIKQQVVEMVLSVETRLLKQV